MTDYAMPAPPPLAIDTLWDVYGDQWCRVDEPLAANQDPDESDWVPRDCLGDEPSITANVVDWRELVFEYGPLSDTAPKETP